MTDISVIPRLNSSFRPAAHRFRSEFLTATKGNGIMYHVFQAMLLEGRISQAVRGAAW